MFDDDYENLNVKNCIQVNWLRVYIYIRTLIGLSVLLLGANLAARAKHEFSDRSYTRSSLNISFGFNFILILTHETLPES